MAIFEYKIETKIDKNSFKICYFATTIEKKPKKRKIKG